MRRVRWNSSVWVKVMPAIPPSCHQRLTMVYATETTRHRSRSIYLVEGGLKKSNNAVLIKGPEGEQTP